MGCNLLEQGAFEAAIGIGCSLHFQNGFDPSRHVIGKVTRVEFSCKPVVDVNRNISLCRHMSWIEVV
jgi:hypothetical protein